MSLFDYFEPAPPFGCHRPGCIGTLTRWQGQHSNTACSFLWRQGLLSPADQLVPQRIKAKPDKRSMFRLPSNAAIHAYGATCDTCQAYARFDIECETDAEGLWISTKIQAKIAASRVIEREWIQCMNCYDAWRRIEGKRLYLCPTCEGVIQQ